MGAPPAVRSRSCHRDRTMIEESTFALLPCQGQGFVPFFTPLRPEQFMCTGYHVGRRRADAEPALHVVYVTVYEEAGAWYHGVWTPGAEKPERVEAWEFAYRIAGLGLLEAHTIDLPATAH